MHDHDVPAVGDRAVHDRLSDAGARWRDVQPEARGVDASRFAQDRPRFTLPDWAGRAGTFLAGAASAALIIGAAIAWTPLGGRGPITPGAAATTDPGSGFIPTGAEHCPLTRPHWSGGDAAPADWGTPPEGSGWYGSERLAAQLDGGGTQWNGLPRSDLGYAQKTFWWRAGYRASEEPQPQISVTGRRLDGPGSFGFGPGTNASAPEIGNAMLVGVDIPSTGCWQLTASYRGDELGYVVWVGP